MALAWTIAGAAAAQEQLCGASIVTVTPANNAPPPKKSDASSVTLAPEVEKKLQELLDKIKVKKGEYWDDQMKKEIDEIARTTGLKDWTPLNAAAKQAVAASLYSYAPKLPDMFRKQIALIPKEQVLAMLDQAQEQIGAMAQADPEFTGDMVAPDEQEVWTKALQQALTPAQFDAWTQTRAKHKEESEKEISNVLKNGADRTQAMQNLQIEAECRRIETALNLPKDRADKLEALGKSAVDQGVAAWRKRVEKCLLSMDENQRRLLLTSNGFYMGANGDESPSEQPAWKDGLAQLLTVDDQARLQAAADVRKARREHVMGEVMVMLLDEKLALTEAQRQKLQPLADRLVKDIPALYPESGPENGPPSYSPDVFYGACAKAGEAELKPILDQPQLQRWQSLAKPDPSQQDTVESNANPETNAKPEDNAGSGGRGKSRLELLLRKEPNRTPALARGGHPQGRGRCARGRVERGSHRTPRSGRPRRNRGASHGLEGVRR